MADEVYAQVTVGLAPSTVNYPNPVTGSVSGGVYRISDNVRVADLTTANAVVNSVSITDPNGFHDYLAENNFTVTSFTQQRYQPGSKSWTFNIDTTRYHSTVTACGQHIDTGMTDCDTGTYNVNGAPYVSLNVVFPDLQDLIVPLAAGCGTNCPNFTKPMPIKFEATGTSSGGQECTGTTCTATYSVDNQPDVPMSYDGFAEAFVAAPLSQALACSQTHLLTVTMTETSSGASSQRSDSFFISCEPAVTVSPVEKRFTLGDRNADAFNVTIWNPLDTTSFTLNMEAKRPQDAFVLGFLDFQGDGDTMGGLSVPGLSSQSYTVRLNGVGAGRSGSFPLQFTATDESDSEKQYSADGALLIFAEALPEFALWQLGIAMIIGLFVFYRYGMNTTRASRTRKGR
jgi:hypothetical protein